MWLFTALALAGPTDRYPWAAPIDVPGEGIHRIAVPAELRPAWSPEASGLALVDASGGAVPFAHVATDRAPSRVVATLGSELGVLGVEYWPTPERDGWELAVRDRPADGLEVLLPRTPLATDARLFEKEGEDWVLLAEQVVWRLEDGAVSAPIPMPPRTGVYKLVLDPPVFEPEDTPGLQVVRSAHQVPETTLELEVVSQQVRADGWVRYDILLPQPLALEWVEVQTDLALFDRRAAVEYVEPAATPDELPYPDTPYARGSIQRTRIGGASIDHVRVRPEGSPTRRLALYVEASGAEPVPIERVTAGMAGLELLVQDVGDGPLTLLAGAPRGTTPDSDLQFVWPELTRMAPDTAIAPGARRDNPAYVPPETRGRLEGPSGALDLKPFGWRYPIEGGAGLVRIPLSDEVLARARPDLGDVRIVDAAGNQIPFLLEDDGELHRWGELPFQRTERGEQSVLEVTLPQPNVLVGVVTLSTEAPLFDRNVTLSRPAAGRLQTLRALRWSGLDRPSTVTIPVNQRIGETLVVQIDNGDDPPLPVTAIEAAWPGWEAIAVVPEGGASLVVGAPRVQRPDYDLWLLRSQLRDRATATAALGAPEKLSPPALSNLDKGLVAFGVGVMAFGLLGLTVVLIRGAPADPKPEPGEPDDPEPEAPEPDADADSEAA